MKAFRRLTLVALVLVSAVVVVASPAFATPRLTTSTGTTPDGGAVSPFVTPIGDTLTSSLTISVTFAARRGLSIATVNFNGIVLNETCIRFTVSAHAAATHTRLSVSSLNVDGCRLDETGAFVQVSVAGISSSNPAKVHITSIVGGSGIGTLEIPPGAGISLHIKADVAGRLTACSITINPQSILLAVTTATRTIEVRDTRLRFSLDRGFLVRDCPDPSRVLTVTTGTAIPYTPDAAGGARNIAITATS